MVQQEKNELNQSEFIQKQRREKKENRKGEIYNV